MVLALALLGWGGVFVMTGGDELSEALDEHCQSVLEGGAGTLPMDAALGLRFGKLPAPLLALTFEVSGRELESAHGRFHFDSAGDVVDSGDIPFVARWREGQWWLESSP